MNKPRSRSPVRPVLFFWQLVNAYGDIVHLGLRWKLFRPHCCLGFVPGITYTYSRTRVSTERFSSPVVRRTKQRMTPLRPVCVPLEKRVRHFADKDAITRVTAAFGNRIFIAGPWISLSLSLRASLYSVSGSWSARRHRVVSHFVKRTSSN